MVETKSMNMPKISIIVPVYKAEAYLHRCVDSILAQTFTDFELLLIDDGSPDRSGDICDEYAKKDTRIRVIHKENGGVSSARQRGLDESIGEYTIHADPDDWIESNMLEEMYTAISQENGDLLLSDFYKDYNGNSQYVCQTPETLDHNTVMKGLYNGIYGACWNKMVKRSIVRKYNVIFPKGWNLAEDQYFFVSLLLHDIKIVYINKAYYHYVLGENENSLANVVKMTYSYYVMLYNAFDFLTKNNPNNYLIKSVYSLFIIKNEFERHESTSLEFTRKCLPYLLWMINSKIPIKTKCMFVFSCLGFYKIIYNLRNILK